MLQESTQGKQTMWRICSPCSSPHSELIERVRENLSEKLALFHDEYSSIPLRTDINVPKLSKVSPENTIKSN